MLSECIYKVLMASGVVTSSDACDLSGAIEAAVLEAQKEGQEPGYFALTKDHTWISVTKNTFDNCAESHRMVCYAAPVVQPGMVMEGFKAACAFIDSHVADPDITSEMRKTYAEFMRMRAMIAAAEGKG